MNFIDHSAGLADTMVYCNTPSGESSLQIFHQSLFTEELPLNVSSYSIMIFELFEIVELVFSV